MLHHENVGNLAQLVGQQLITWARHPLARARTLIDTGAAAADQ
jgi:hypothetical protein